MQYQGFATGKPKDKILSPPADILDHLAGEAPSQLFG
jgi:hypothetical protein